MGLFETCEDLIRSRIIDLQSFSRSYEYRVKNIVANTRIVEKKLVELGGYWKRFRHLAKRLGLKLPPLKADV